MKKKEVAFVANIEFEAIKLPPVTDILVLGKKFPQGKIGVMESFRFIAPDEFEMFDIGPEEKNVEAVLINKKILKRISEDRVIKLLKEYVFPYTDKGEAIKVGLRLIMKFEQVKG